MPNPIKILLVLCCWSFSSFCTANSELKIVVASEGNTDKGLHTEFSVYAFPIDETLSIRVESLPASASFSDKGDGSGRFIWNSPTVGSHTMTFDVKDKTGTYTKEFTLKVGDYGYPPENAGQMMMPEFPPSVTSTVIYVAVSGKDSNQGTETAPLTLYKALDKARLTAKSATKPVYVLFKRGDYWKGIDPFVIRKDLKGGKSSPIVFGSYGEGSIPRFESMISEADIEYLHFQDMRFDKVIIQGNKYGFGSENYPGTNVKKLTLNKRFEVQRLRFHQCKFEIGNLMFFNLFTNASRGSRVPNSNGWWGGGPVAGMIRDVEIGYSTFLHTEKGGTPDAINFFAVDRGVWIHHNTFKDTKEEHIDISGGYGHIIEHNKGVGTVTNNGIKLHSQFSLLTDSIVRYNTVLYSGGWKDKLVGGKGNAFVATNVMGCHIHDNNFISRWAAFYGDDNRTDDRGYFGTFAGNIVENNIYFGGVQIAGVLINTIDQITSRNTFKNNMYRAWPDDNKLIRYWGKQLLGKVLVSKNIDPGNFSDWTGLHVKNERLYNNLSEVFVAPISIDNPNEALDTGILGNWERKTQEQ